MKEVASAYNHAGQRFWLGFSRAYTGPIADNPKLRVKPGRTDAPDIVADAYLDSAGVARPGGAT